MTAWHPVELQRAIYPRDTSFIKFNKEPMLLYLITITGATKVVFLWFKSFEEAKWSAVFAPHTEYVSDGVEVLLEELDFANKSSTTLLKQKGIEISVSHNTVHGAEWLNPEAYKAVMATPLPQIITRNKGEK